MKNVKTLASGRTIYRHENGQGSVIEFDMFGRKTKLFVADAKYRTAENWGLPKDHGMTKYEKICKHINPNDIEDAGDEPLPYILTDAQLQAQFPSFSNCKTETAKSNTDNLMKFSYTNTRAAHRCREIKIDGVGELDIPNIYELMVLYLESDAIDALDPTLESFVIDTSDPTLDYDGIEDLDPVLDENLRCATGMKNTYGRFNPYNFNGLWSSCENSGPAAFVILRGGIVGTCYKDFNFGVYPVKELD